MVSASPLPDRSGDGRVEERQQTFVWLHGVDERVEHVDDVVEETS